MIDQILNNSLIGEMLININLDEIITFELILTKEIEAVLGEYTESLKEDKIKCFRKNVGEQVFYLLIENNKSVDKLLMITENLIKFASDKKLRDNLLKEKLEELKKLISSSEIEDLKALEIKINKD